MGKSITSKLVHQMPCKKCGGKMKRGIAIEEAFTGTSDFAGCEIVTMSPGGKGKVVACLKCIDCGWSIT